MLEVDAKGQKTIQTKKNLCLKFKKLMFKFKKFKKFKKLCFNVYVQIYVSMLMTEFYYDFIYDNLSVGFHTTDFLTWLSSGYWVESGFVRKLAFPNSTVQEILPQPQLFRNWNFILFCTVLHTENPPVLWVSHWVRKREKRISHQAPKSWWRKLKDQKESTART